MTAGLCVVTVAHKLCDLQNARRLKHSLGCFRFMNIGIKSEISASHRKNHLIINTNNTIKGVTASGMRINAIKTAHNYEGEPTNT